jgi:hypothetical protein
LLSGYYSTRPVLLSARIAEVLAAGARATAQWTLEESLNTPAEVRFRV